MNIDLYLDENVHGSIATQFRRRGVDVLTVVEDHRTGISDPEVLDRATELRRLLYSEDDDLLREAQARQMRGESFVGVVYGHHLRLTIGQAVEDLAFIAEAGQLSDFADRVEYLPL